VRPEIDGGRFPIKRVAGENVVVEADVFCDGHDVLSCRVLYRAEGAPAWEACAMRPIGNDRWRGEFRAASLGAYVYTIEGWVDHFATWRRDLALRVQAGQDVTIDLEIGAALLDAAAASADGADANSLTAAAGQLRGGGDRDARAAAATDENLAALAGRYPARELATRYDRELRVVVDSPKARFSSWYEAFPRSCAETPGQHGTLRDCERRLPELASMGFDVLYLPPIHPIGQTFRKGKNNAVVAGAGDVGSPWAIGSADGGHTAIHADLGSLDDLRSLVEAARRLGIDVALDLAFQCSPDHPYVREHPEWFRKRPDGTIQYAENPPKKYQDIYPLDFETPAWQELWTELLRVIEFWTGQGIRLFRVDNPHTKAFPFWEWVIGIVRERHPDVLFLAEAFTRPKVMQRLAKLGFSQSYTYFAWRNTKEELTAYFRELTRTDVREYLRPNLWPNTPDILPEYLQIGGRPGFMIRFVLAATLGASYGVYGPAFELAEDRPREPGSEEYLDSEKYEIRPWNRGAEWSLKDFMARINRVRRENPALQSDWNLRFHDTDNPSIICYSKATDDLSNVIVVAVNLDPFHTQSGWVHLDLAPLGLDADKAFQVDDLLSGIRQLWQGPKNYVELPPDTLPAHVFRVRTRVRSERDFDYYL
jgi:starch synthase (maltosyl-transferring)